MFTLYRIGFCSVSKVAPVQCEQELMFCCGAEIVPKRSQCEQKPYPLCNLQRSLLIWKDNLPIRGSVTISAPIKVFRLDSDRLKNLSDTGRSTFNSGAEQYCSGAETASKAAFLVWTGALSDTLSATLRFTIRYSVNIAIITVIMREITPHNVGSVLWRLFSTLEVVQYIGGITSVLWGDSFSTVGG